MLPDFDEPITTDDASEIEAYTESLMQQADVDLENWDAEIFGGKRALGMADAEMVGHGVGSGKIKISKPWFVKLGVDLLSGHAENFNRGVLENCIRHEIAHAIDIEQRGRGVKGTAHGRRWQEVAIACGAEPTSCCHDLPTKLLAPWKRVCPDCGQIYKLLYRYAERDGTYCCSQCSSREPLEVVKNEECLV
jgi:predicted SprT family Zn-dependent metalloprotease